MTLPQPLAAGIDIGGTNLELALVTRKGTLAWKNTLSTQRFDQFHHLLASAAHALLQAVTSFPNTTLVGCGIGAPNGNVFTGNIEHAPNLPWKGIVPVCAVMENLLGVRAFLTNDANAGALGELQFGAAQGCKDFIFITLGTGLGSGIVSNGALMYGHDGFAGELGHVIVEPGGRPCRCGRKGCLETYCSATGLLTTYRQLVSEKHAAKHAHEVFQRAAQGEPEAIEAFSQTGQRLGLALANAVAVTSPKVIFLFGGLTRAGDLLLSPTRESFEKNLHVLYRNNVELRLSALPQSEAALLGAASLVWNAQHHE